MNNLDFAFGVLGNIVSFMVFLAPVPTFYQIYKKKSSEGFQSITYVVSLFSAMLWIYYAFLHTDTTLLITINSVGCFVQTIYIGFFLFYASNKARIQTIISLVSMNVVGYGLIVLLTQILTKGANRGHVIGWICLVFSLCVFVAPLFIVRKVIKTKSVEYMPFLLSLFLTLSAVMWFFYGLLRKDYIIAIPNILGFSFGILQMILYMIFKNAKKVVEEKLEEKLPEIQNQILVLEENKLGDQQIIDVMKLSAIVCSEIIPVIAQLTDNGGHDIVGDIIPPPKLPAEVSVC